MRYLFTFFLIFLSLFYKAQFKNFQTFYSMDSLSGFNEVTEKAKAVAENSFGNEFKFYMSRAKRQYINQKYNLSSTSLGFSNYRFNPSNNQIMAACTNMDFETGTFSGWTLTSGYNSNSTTMGGCCPTAGGISVVVPGSGTDPISGASLVSPFGGSFICKINDQNIGSVVERISQTFNVTAANSLLQFAYLANLESAGHSCVDQPFLNIRLLDCSNNIIACPQAQILAPSSSCSSSSPGFVNGGSYYYNNLWQVSALDLTPYIGSCITVQITVGDCTQGGHYGYSYFDAQCLPMNISVNNVQFPVGTNATTVSLCGSLTATVSAPPGLSPYTWNGPTGSGVTNLHNQTFTTTTAGLYTLSMNPIGSCAPIVRVVNLQVAMPPIAGFTFNSTPCTNSITVQSTSSLNSGPAISNLQWVWGDATPNSTVNPSTHTYAASGPKQVKLVITNAAGCQDSITQTINITQKPVANFTFNPGCSGSAINFTNTSTTPSGSNNSAWDFGDASGSAASNPAHNYTNSGSYTVTLVITNTDGCIDSIKQTVNVYGRAVVNFTPTGVCFGAVSNFTNLTTTSTNPNTGSIGTSSWSFGDGGSSTVLNPSYTYTSPANATANTNYNAWLYVTTSHGCKDSINKSITVYSLPTPNFIADSACFNSPTTLTSTGNNNGNPNFNYLWDFNGDNIPDMSTASSPTTNIFLNVGNNSVTFTVITSPNGGLLQCKNGITKNVWVRATPLAVITNTNKCLNSAIGLSAANSTIANGSITNYAWNYGNSTSSLTNATPSTSVNYATSGNYVVTLTVTGSGGCPGITTKTVSVFGRAVVDFTPTGVCFGAASNFTNLTNTTINANTGAIATNSWSFGNGGTSLAQNPVYTYTNPANQTANTVYTVNLYVTTVNGCKDSITKPITVYSLPTPNFTADSVCFGTATTLTDLSSTNGNSLFLYAWDFNGDNVPDLSNNSVSSTTTFTNWGNTAVTYTVYTTPNGGALTCNDKITKNVWVHPLPVAVITHTNKCIDFQPNLMNGANSTLAVGTITNYAWNYGNGNTNLINPLSASSFSYNLAGNYLITLTVTSAAGCTNVATQSSDVWERPYADFSYSKACAGKQIILKSNQLPTSAPITTFEWDLNNTVASVEATGAQVTYTYAAGGTQTINLLITSNQGCKNTVPGPIYVNYNPKPNFYAPKRAGCADLCIPILDSTQAVPLPAKNVSWEWDFGNQTYNVSNQSNTQHTCFANTSNLTVQDYNLKLIVRTDSGCVDSISKLKYVRAYPNPKADFEWVGKDGDLLTPFIAFQNTSIGYNRFAWYYNDGVNITDSTNQNPTHYYNTDVPRNFEVFLAVRNQYGCKDTTTKYVEIGPEFTFYIPNTFTPDDDGINETFTGTGIGIKAFKMWIYDRWGEKIYYTEDIKTGWDGTIKGKQGKEKVDVYTYKVIVTDLWHKDHDYVGHVTLLK